MSLEDIEKKLYARGSKSEPPSASKPKISQPPEQKIEEKWFGENEPPKIIHSHKKRRGFLFLMVIFFVVVIAIGIYLISQYLNAPTVKMDISAPSEIFVGVPFNASIIVNNTSNHVLHQASLTIDLPDGLVYITSAEENKNVINENIGDIETSDLIKKTYSLLALSDESKIKNVKIRLSYQAGLGTSFEQEETKDIAIKKSAVSLKLDVPDQVVGGSVFNIEVNYKNDSNFNFSNLDLEMTYPSSFQFISADPDPTSFNNLWRLQEAKAGISGKIQIKGSINEAFQKGFDFQAALKTNINKKSYVVNQQKATGQLAPAPISLFILINNSPDYVAKLGDKIQYTIQYQNNSGVALADNIIKARLIGELFDIFTLQTNSSINSLTNTLTWNTANTPELRLLNPGAGGNVNFSIQLKPNFPIRRLNDKNFHLKIEAQMDSPTVPYYLSAPKTSALTNLETKIQGLTTIEAKAYFRDANSGILNSGPFPPKVNQATEYTIHWTIKNYSTDVSNVKVSAFLKSGVVFTGAVKSNISSQPTYNNLTQEVIWNIDKIVATKGIISEPIEAIFQIQATPNVTQVKHFQPLLGQTKIEVQDNYTGVTLENAALPVNTQLPYDLTVKPEEGAVQF